MFSHIWAENSTDKSSMSHGMAWDREHTPHRSPRSVSSRSRSLSPREPEPSRVRCRRCSGPCECCHKEASSFRTDQSSLDEDVIMGEAGYDADATALDDLDLMEIAEGLIELSQLERVSLMNHGERQGSTPDGRDTMPWAMVGTTQTISSGSATTDLRRVLPGGSPNQVGDVDDMDTMTIMMDEVHEMAEASVPFRRILPVPNPRFEAFQTRASRYEPRRTGWPAGPAWKSPYAPAIPSPIAKFRTPRPSPPPRSRLRRLWNEWTQPLEPEDTEPPRKRRILLTWRRWKVEESRVHHNMAIQNEALGHIHTSIAERRNGARWERSRKKDAQDVLETMWVRLRDVPRRLRTKRRARLERFTCRAVEDALTTICGLDAVETQHMLRRSRAEKQRALMSRSEDQGGSPRNSVEGVQGHGAQSNGAAEESPKTDSGIATRLRKRLGK